MLVDRQLAREAHLRTGVASHVLVSLFQPRRRLGWRQPLWGTGVTSLIDVTSMPVFWMERTAVSRPEPGTRAPRPDGDRAPSRHWRSRSAACWAAYGVLLRLPLKPTAPDDAHEMTLPWRVGDGDDRVVERALDVDDTRRDVLADRACGGGDRPAWPLPWLTSSQPSSCWPPCAWGPCGYGRWCGCAGRGPAGPCGGGRPAGSRSRSCA